MALERAVLPNSPEPGTSHAEWTAALEGGGTLMTSPITRRRSSSRPARRESRSARPSLAKRRPMTVVVEGIEQATRSVTVKKPDGTYEIFMPREIKRFDTLKAGDRITATYYDNVVLQLRPPGSNPPTARRTRSREPTAAMRSPRRTSAPSRRRLPRSMRRSRRLRLRA